MDRRLVNEAVDWYVRMHDGPPSAATRAQFTDWLLLSPEHIRAFLEVTESIEPLSAVDASSNIARDLDREKLVAHAAEDQPTSNVVSLDGLSSPPVAREREVRIKAIWIAVIAGAALGAGALFGWFACDRWHHFPPLTATCRTALDTGLSRTSVTVFSLTY